MGTFIWIWAYTIIPLLNNEKACLYYLIMDVRTKIKSSFDNQNHFFYCVWHWDNVIVFMMQSQSQVKFWLSHCQDSPPTYLFRSGTRCFLFVQQLYNTLQKMRQFKNLFAPEHETIIYCQLKGYSQKKVKLFSKS